MSITWQGDHWDIRDEYLQGGRWPAITVKDDHVIVRSVGGPFKITTDNKIAKA